jgi:hypothetical protein
MRSRLASEASVTAARTGRATPNAATSTAVSATPTRNEYQLKMALAQQMQKQRQHARQRPWSPSPMVDPGRSRSC